MSPQVSRNDDGFTLIEILVVVIVLSILAAIVLMATGTFKDDSITAACKTDSKSVETAAASYYSKYHAEPAAVEDLVTAGYLRSNPNTAQSHYTITLDADGNVATAC